MIDRIYSSIFFKIFVLLYFAFTIPYFFAAGNDYTDTVILNYRLKKMEDIGNKYNQPLLAAPCIKDDIFDKRRSFEISDPKELEL